MKVWVAFLWATLLVAWCPTECRAAGGMWRRRRAAREAVVNAPNAEDLKKIELRAHREAADAMQGAGEDEVLYFIEKRKKELVIELFPDAGGNAKKYHANPDDFWESGKGVRWMARLLGLGMVLIALWAFRVEIAPTHFAKEAARRKPHKYS